MFPNQSSVFENVSTEHRSDYAGPAASPQAPMGASPDGLGAHAGPGMGEYFSGPQQGAQGMGAYARPTGGQGGFNGELPILEPLDTSPAAAMRTAGVTALVAAMIVAHSAAGMTTAISCSGPNGPPGSMRSRTDPRSMRLK